MYCVAATVVTIATLADRFPSTEQHQTILPTVAHTMQETDGNYGLAYND